MCHLKDSTGKEVELLVGGGKFGSDADITLENGQVVGTISRDLTTDKMMLKNKQAVSQYGGTVADSSGM